MITARLFLVLIAILPAVAAADELIVRNDSTGPGEVWLWPKSQSAWERPELLVPAKRAKGLKFNVGELYWMIARDHQKREIPIGWVDISQKLKDDPKTELRLMEVFEQRMETRSFWNQCLRRWERRDVTHTVSRIIPVWKSPALEKEDR